MSKEPILNNPLEQYLREVNAYQLLSREEEYELATHYRDSGDPAAARALVTANLRFVVKVAYQFSNYDIKLTDLVQEGNIGLMKAVQKFKPDTGYRLISYAVWWIKAYIQNYIINTWSLVRVGPVAQQRKVLFGKRELPAPSVQGHGDVKRLGADGSVEVIDVDANVVDPTSDEATFLIAAESATAPTKRRRKARKPTPGEVDGWRKAAHAARRDMNIDNTISEDGRMTLGETLSSDDPTAEEQYASAQITAMVADRLSELHADLNEKELTILEERLLAEDGRTLADVGKQYGISRERVRQIEANLKKKIARRLEGLSPIALLEPPRA
ncbi:MAG: sigma-70 family RNA polymerase sigma factor [Myxococcales bacterium]|nr:sigma-70 family RNA polymerase sigma factor [Myxococcales bacterium]